MSCISAPDPQLTRLAEAIAQRVGPQRFHVWFNNSTRLDLKQDGLEIAVPNDFISEWITRNFSKPIADAAREVLGGGLPIRFTVMPQLFEAGNGEQPAAKPHALRNAEGTDVAGRGAASPGACRTAEPHRSICAPPGATAAVPLRADSQPPSAHELRAAPTRLPLDRGRPLSFSSPARLRHDIESFVVGPSNQLAYNAATHVAQFPGVQYNPLFMHGACGLGKTHLLQGLCRKFLTHHPAGRWAYLTGEEFTNEFLAALRNNRLDGFRRKLRDLDLLVIDDVHFIAGKKATQEEFLHTFNAIEAMGRQVVMASDNHPRMIEAFGESLVNRFISGMVVRIDPPNLATRCGILRNLAQRHKLQLDEEVVSWIARRVTQNVRELEGAITRVSAHVKLTGRNADMALVQEALSDLQRQLVQPVKPENILQAVCTYFGVEERDLMSGRRERTISLARSLAMHLIRKTGKLSFPEIGMRMGKRNHSTVISACRRMERAVQQNLRLSWTTSVGEREEDATELIQRLEEMGRAMM